jgi:cation:H+ antiporter
MVYLQVLAGFVLLLGGAEVAVRGSATLARRLGVSPLIIGMTVVAFGTSAPELVVTLNAALSDASGIAVGNIVGSNIANVLLILGVSGAVMPIPCDPRLAKHDGVVLAGATLLFSILCLFGTIAGVQATVLLLMFSAFLGYTYWRERGNRDPAAKIHVLEAEEIEEIPGSTWVALATTAAGIAGIVWGADMLVDGGIDLARHFGVPEEVIGLTMIAIGTSLPELAASAVAAARGHPDIALGNVIGSNMFNMLGVMGVVAMVAPLPVPQRILTFDLWVMVAASVALVVFLLSRSRLSRAEAWIFIVAYLAYLGAQAYEVEHVSPTF